MSSIYRRDPARNMARFYLIDTCADLFGGVSLLREWGRIGRAGPLRMDTHADARAAEKLATRKRQRGHQ